MERVTELTFAPKESDQLVYLFGYPLGYRSALWHCPAKDKINQAVGAWTAHSGYALEQAAPGELSPDHLPVLRDYFCYHIHAPAWDQNPFRDASLLESLRQQAQQIDTWEKVGEYLEAAGELYDPL
jgi:hypothetical protein